MKEGVFFHGGKAGLQIGELVIPAPAHVEDGCPICEAKRAGRRCTVGEFRVWLRRFGVRAEPVLRKLAGAADSDVIDPPRASADGIYFTTDEDYALWYAARSGNGDLYQVSPIGEYKRSAEDHFQTFVAASARVVRVIRRGVQLTRTDRRRIERRWKKADKRAMHHQEPSRP